MEHEIQTNDERDVEGADGEFAPPPKWPKPVGVLSIVFGSIAVTCGGAGIALMPVWSGLIEAQLNGDPMPPSMTLSGLEYLAFGASLTMNMLLIVAGATCVARKGLSRGLHLVYAMLMFAVVGLGVLAQIAEQGAMKQWVLDYPSSEFAKQTAKSMDSAAPMIFMVAISALSLAWPVFCLIWFGAAGRKPDAGVEGDMA
jgi:hypothetical protein